LNELYQKTDEEIESMISEKISAVESEGYTVTFGTIGNRTTYCMISNGDDEILGYTYIRGDLSNKRPTIGKYKALIQSLNRKYLLYDSQNNQ